MATPALATSGSGSDWIGIYNTVYSDNENISNGQAFFNEFPGPTHQAGLDSLWSLLDNLPWVHINGSGCNGGCTIGGTNGWQYYLNNVPSGTVGSEMGLYSVQSVSGTDYPYMLISSCTIANGVTTGWNACTASLTGQTVQDSNYFLALLVGGGTGSAVVKSGFYHSICNYDGCQFNNIAWLSNVTGGMSSLPNNFNTGIGTGNVTAQNNEAASMYVIVQ